MKNKTSKSFFILFTIMLFFIEIVLSTSYRNIYGYYKSPVILFLSATILGALILYLSIRSSKVQDISHEKLNYKITHATILLSLWLIGFTSSVVISNQCFNTWHIDIYDYTLSDVIPQIGWMVKRFLNGETPYQLITVWTYDLFPTYQTFQWAPYCLAEIFNFDYRWVPFGVLSISLGLFHKIQISSKIGFYYKCIFSILPWLILILFIYSGMQQYANTVESLIAAYYLLFALSLFYSSTFIKASMTIICLLSRYSLILWLPLLCLSLFFKNKASTVRYIVYVISGVLVFYVIPFLYSDPLIFIKGFEYHTLAANNLWNHPYENLQNTIFTGLGLSGFFYDFVDGDILTRLAVLKKAHILLSTGFVILCSVAFFIYREMINNTELYLLGTFKIYLAIFYGFIQLPFHYLFLVPLFVSLICVFKLISNLK